MKESAPGPHRIGELIGGKYRIVRFLATGGMGVVYEAQHEVVKRRFAVKLLRADLAARRDILARFQLEAEAAGALESENVTAAVDFGIADDGTPYIVMEYLVGQNLAAVLAQEGRLPVDRATDLVAQACRGMQAAHGAGIVHRDLKPQNLFVCRREDGTDLVKVLDFGVAKLQAVDEASAATRTGAVMGTASYMAPEQARGDKVVDHRADVYALGAILYELLSGKVPHPGDSHNAILHHISTQPAVPLDRVQPGLPGALVEVINRALSSEPGDRPASVESFGLALGAFGQRQVWPAAVSRSPPRRRTGVPLVVGAVALAVVAVAIGVALRASRIRSRAGESEVAPGGAGREPPPATTLPAAGRAEPSLPPSAPTTPPPAPATPRAPTTVANTPAATTPATTTATFDRGVAGRGVRPSEVKPPRIGARRAGPARTSSANPSPQAPAGSPNDRSAPEPSRAAGSARAEPSRPAPSPPAARSSATKRVAPVILDELNPYN